MRKSRFLNVFKSDEVYLLHNALRGTLLKAKCSRTRAVVDEIESAGSLILDENNKFHIALKDLHMVVDDAVDETDLLRFYFSESGRELLYIIPIVTPPLPQL